MRFLVWCLTKQIYVFMLTLLKPVEVRACLRVSSSSLNFLASCVASSARRRCSRPTPSSFWDINQATTKHEQRMIDPEPGNRARHSLKELLADERYNTIIGYIYTNNKRDLRISSVDSQFAWITLNKRTIGLKIKDGGAAIIDPLTR